MTKMSFAEFVRLTFPGAVVTPLSATNNEIFKVEDGATTLTAKRMIDADVPIPYFVQCSEALGRRLPVPRIERVFREAEGAPFDCIVSEFVEGRDLAAALAGEGPARIDDEELVAFLTRYVGAFDSLPRMFEGFGLYKKDALRFSDHGEFLRAYADKYWQRVRPFVDAPAARQVDAWIADGIEAASAAPSGFQAVVVDSNLRNFVLAEDGSLVLLNVPIVGWSTRAHGVAAVAAHLRPFPARRLFLERATRGWPAEEYAAVGHLEAWTLLGILSFYAVRAPAHPAEWRNWGATRGLRDDFTSLVAELA
ncbi:MAG: hypothetical protein JOZ90_14990 [Alphaproteobacteria bacterium]|nr:hypothetical protein [Alphaproteobacteria bacterium]MBV9371442.1 hypothetical protein [Alphaproteobacteria bacterium]MBV9902379.1 hypothetical protein [Alphaproteobacteria bacterium]